MPIKIDTSQAIKDVSRGLQLLQRRQIPQGAANGLNEIANALKADLLKAMKSDFDRPTAYTLNSLFVKYAKKNDLEIVVGIKDLASKGTPASKYLEPEIEGGARRMKRFERRLAAVSGGQFIIPAAGAKIDSYGNISRAQIGQILAQLGLSDPSVAQSKAQRRLAKQGLVVRQQLGQYFVARDKSSGRAVGVYQLLARGRVQPVLIFTTKAPHYGVRYPFASIGRASVARHLAPAMRRGLERALATAR